MDTITLWTNDRKPSIEIAVRNISRVEYKAATDSPEPRRAHLQIEVTDGDTTRTHVFKGPNAEVAWAVLVPAARTSDLRDDIRQMSGRVDRVTRGVDALLRFYFADRLDLPSPQRFVAKRARLLSNDDEDGITMSLLAEIGVESRTFAEVACGTNGGNSGFLALECGWTGLMVDADSERLDAARQLFRYADVRFVESFVTIDDINDLLTGAGLTGSIDLLSIDIDGNDYWVWDAVTAASPRLVIIEYNSYFGPDRSVALPYDPAFDRHRYANFVYGASLQAMTRLAQKKGYRLVATEPRGHNAYFLRNDVGPAIPSVDPAAAWRLLDKYEKRMRGKQEDLYAFVEREGLQLVEIV
jgi:predicted O-methyltransferase YrrM